MEATNTTQYIQSARVLILKFSSIGDIFQCLAAADAIKASLKPVTIDWAIRGDLAAILEESQAEGLIQTIYAHSRNGGIRDLYNLAQHLSQREYTHIYDAHGSLRSRLLCAYIRFASIGNKRLQVNILRRSKHRLRRFLKLRLGIRRILSSEVLSFPWNAENSYVLPLSNWGIREVISVKKVRDAQQTLVARYGLIVPGSAWEMKNWPVSHWRELILRLDRNPNCTHHWIILGGEKDAICKALMDKLSADSLESLKVESLAGQTSVRQAMDLIKGAAIVVGVDTGWIHWSNRLGVPTLSIQGPSAFGGIFNSKSRNILSTPLLDCQPCSKDGSGKCRNRDYKKCLTGILPDQVFTEIQELLKNSTK